jgi:hypothetical protein
MNIWLNKTWYDVLGTSNKYLSFDEFRYYIRNLKLKDINEKTFYDKYNEIEKD